MATNSQLLAERISCLQKMCYDEGELCDEESLKDLLSFLEINDTMPIPSLVVTPPGYFRATWKDTNEEGKLSIEFLGNYQLRFVVRMSDNIFSLNYKGK